MQVKKENIKDKIMDSACKEFLENGYVGASLRVIAKNAGLTKGAVYSYFKNKDSLFYELVKPAINFIENRESVKNDNLTDPCSRTIYEFKMFAEAVLVNYESFKLLLFCSAGSNLQDYKESIIQRYAQNFHQVFRFFTSEQYQENLLSEMFIHTLATTYLSFIEEIILHKPDHKEIENYVEQIAVFVHCGINNLVKHLKNKK